MEYAVIMAGGGGTRLWPAARRAQPKQVQKLIFEEPLIASTVHRLNAVFPCDRILVVTAERYAQEIRDMLPEIPTENVIAEPVGRNTAAAIALAAFHIVRDDPDAIFAVFPADHVITKSDALFHALAYANDLARRHRVVDIGVPPVHPETGYGYIELGEEIGRERGIPAYTVRRFVEKPDLETAREYLGAGNYIWNSGMFVWRACEFLGALQEYLPATYSALQEAYGSGDPDALRVAYEGLENISVDYAIMERTSDVVALSVDFGWHDVGDWSALYEMMEHDDAGNAFAGDHVTLDVRNSLIYAPNKLVTAIGVDDLVIVDTGGVLLVMPRGRAQDVKKLLDRLKESGQDAVL